jgi:glycine reductase complex component B subunit alpha and beta
MRLQLDSLTIRDVQFAAETTVRDGVLHIEKKALRSLLLRDQRFATIDIEIAHPGERCRITGVLDVVEPRAKTSVGDEDFPGAVGKQISAGNGSTCVLKGTAVVLCDYRERLDSGRSGYPNGDIIDMSGPGADAGLYGKTHNIVLLTVPGKGVSGFDYLAALKVAGLKASAYLAGAGKGLTPDRTEVMDIPALMARDEAVTNLPRIVYVFQILSTQFDPIPGEPILYGGNVPDMVPTLLHPNEVIDGAVTSQLPALNLQTFQIQNHPIIRELAARHGRELFFTGVIVSTAPNNMADIERVSNIAANLARYVGADGVVLTKTGGGAPELTMARTAQRCEQFGMKTALAVLHMAADVYGAATLFNMPEIDAVVSLGVPNTHMALPAVERVVGRQHAAPNFPPIDGPIVRTEGGIKGGQCQVGTFPFRAVRY